MKALVIILMGDHGAWTRVIGVDVERLIFSMYFEGTADIF